MTSVPVVEHRAGEMHLDLRLESLAISHVLLSEGCVGNGAVEEACEKIEGLAEGKATTRATCVGQGSGLYGSEGSHRLEKSRAFGDFLTRQSFTTFYTFQ